MKYKLMATAAAMSMVVCGTEALAQNSWGGPMEVGDGVTLDPIIEARLRYEHVDQDNPTPSADALTISLRAGAELKAGGFSALVEGEATGAIVNDYNAFPFPAEGQNRPYSVIPDPENVELNRAQISYMKDGNGLTVGRQRIILDNARFVGNVGWRQNEQTFDAVRGQAKIGPVSLDATYAIGQRTIFGIDAGGRQAYDGDFIFLNGGVAVGPVKAKAFAYILDYDDPLFAANSSQTYGVLVSASLPLSPGIKLDLEGSYASQSDYKTAAKDYSADYFAAEAALGVKGFKLTAGYELLGSDNGFGFATPMATLHAFNGWADVFLNTPGAGLQDVYGGIAYSFPKDAFLPGLKAAVTYHEFDSDKGGIDYGSEWDALIGFKLGPVGILAKYANYNAKALAVDTEKFWLQAEVKF